MTWLASLDPTLMRPLLAGWITGAAVGLANTAIVTIAVVRSPARPDQLASFRVGISAFTIAAVNGMVIGWTLIGLLAGAAWIAMPAPRFSIAVGTAGLVVLALYAYIRGFDHRGEATVVFASVAVGTLAFALMLPALAAS